MSQRRSFLFQGGLDQMFKDRLWQQNSAEPWRNTLGHIIAWGSGLWGLTRDGKQRDLPVYINSSRNLVKYSKFDNFYQRTEEKFEVKKWRYITQADGYVTKIALSRQSIEL